MSKFINKRTYLILHKKNTNKQQWYSTHSCDSLLSICHKLAKITSKKSKELSQSIFYDFFQIFLEKCRFTQISDETDRSTGLNTGPPVSKPVMCPLTHCSSITSQQYLLLLFCYNSLVILLWKVLENNFKMVLKCFKCFIIWPIHTSL